MDLTDMWNADQRKWGFNINLRTGLLAGFTNGSLDCRFAVLHETGRQCPESVTRFDGSSAQEYLAVPFGDAADNQPGIFILDVAACIADMPR